jgi:hypothetical protein
MAKNITRKLRSFASLETILKNQQRRGEARQDFVLSYEREKNNGNRFKIILKNPNKTYEGNIKNIRDLLLENSGDRVDVRYYYGCSGYPEETFTENYEILKN